MCIDKMEFNIKKEVYSLIKITYNNGKWKMKRKGNIEENYIAVNMLVKQTIKEMTLLNKYSKINAENFIKDVLKLDLDENIDSIDYKR